MLCPKLNITLDLMAAAIELRFEVSLLAAAAAQDYIYNFSYSPKLLLYRVSNRNFKCQCFRII